MTLVHPVIAVKKHSRVRKLEKYGFRLGVQEVLKRIFDVDIPMQQDGKDCIQLAKEAHTWLLSYFRPSNIIKSSSFRHTGAIQIKGEGVTLYNPLTLAGVPWSIKVR